MTFPLRPQGFHIGPLFSMTFARRSVIFEVTMFLLYPALSDILSKRSKGVRCRCRAGLQVLSVSFLLFWLLNPESRILIEPLAPGSCSSDT
jgi:hypothetical protein